MLWIGMVFGLNNNLLNGEILYEPKKYVQRKPNKKVLGASVNKLQNVYDLWENF